MGFAQGLTYGTTGHMIPLTPIIYGNGTMLSDIGEVTEAESAPGTDAVRRYNKLNCDGSSIRDSQATHYQNLKKVTKQLKRQRSDSASSASTIRTEREAAEVFADFDDGVSVDESAFQGDDEESVLGESYRLEPLVAETKTLWRHESRPLDISQKVKDEESSAELSRRAEIILANAKKRLDVS
jgi:uncharacterized protein YfcZ (UPF0381/DUF406 family)